MCFLAKLAIDRLFIRFSFDWFFSWILWVWSILEIYVFLFLGYRQISDFGTEKNIHLCAIICDRR
jgi:hypothetical protein